mgnify:CR=1 FL=1
MPLTSPAFPPGPYRFVNREFFIVTYRTDPDALRAVIPAPLEFTDPMRQVRVHPDARLDRFRRLHRDRPGDSRSLIGASAAATSMPMYLDDESPIAGGREIWGFPKKLASPKLSVEKDTLLGVLRYGPVPVAVATMGFKHRALAHDGVVASLTRAEFLLKIIPHVDGTRAHLRARPLLLRGCHGEGRVGGTRGARALPPRARAGRSVAGAGVPSGTHIQTDLTLGLGTVIHDYLAK